MANQTPKFKVGDRVRHLTESWAKAGTILIVYTDYSPPKYRLKWDCSSGENADPETDLVKLSKLDNVLN